jgi:hypothetical protein
VRSSVIAVFAEFATGHGKMLWELSDKKTWLQGGFMKVLLLLIVSSMVVSCANYDRQIASEDQDQFQKLERVGDYSSGYRQ